MPATPWMPSTIAAANCPGDSPEAVYARGLYEVVQRHEFDVRRAVERGADRRVVRRRDGARRTAVESFAEGQDLRAPRLERGQLQGVLVGFGARVAEEKPVVVAARQPSEAVGQPLLERVLHRIGVEAQPGDLPLYGVDVVRMGVADRDHGVPAVEIEVLGAGRVVDEAASAPDRFDRIERIYVEQFHRVLSFGFRSLPVPEGRPARPRRVAPAAARRDACGCGRGPSGAPGRPENGRRAPVKMRWPSAAAPRFRRARTSGSCSAPPGPRPL